VIRLAASYNRFITLALTFSWMLPKPLVWTRRWTKSSTLDPRLTGLNRKRRRRMSGFPDRRQTGACMHCRSE
jgi:hypothetical protein